MIGAAIACPGKRLSEEGVPDYPYGDDPSACEMLGIGEYEGRWRNGAGTRFRVAAGIGALSCDGGAATGFRG